MKILFIRCNENLEKVNSETNVTGIYPPLAIAYISGYIKKHNKNVDINFLDAHLNKMNEKKTSSYFNVNKFDMFFLQAYSLSWHSVLKTAKIIRKCNENAFIVVGGPQITAYPNESMLTGLFNIGIIGEAEETANNIVKNFNTDKINSIDGTIVNIDNKIILNKPQVLLDDINLLPFPDFDLINNNYFSLTVQKPFATMITSRGCCYNCSFCSQIYGGNKIRYRNAKNVVDEIEIYIKKYMVKEIIFFDETFTFDKGRAIDICNEIIKRKLKFIFNIRTRVDKIDEEILIKLKKAGCTTIHLGIESASEKILQYMNKGITLNDIKNAVSLCKKNSILARGYFILGYPGETKEDILNTINFSKNLNLDFASFTIAIPNPRTLLYDIAMRDKYIEYDYWKNFSLGIEKNQIPYFCDRIITKEFLEKILKKAYFSFYCRPSFILKKLLLIRFYIIRNIFTLLYYKILK
ncbi:MAG: radical SAM protein [Endomicrobiaceae bacterium]|nr:radical SAM protein [Endomicrobiaceae bacterium]